MSETTDKVMRKIAAMEADGWDMSDFRTALAAEVKRREEAERDLADAMGFVKSLMILICGNEYVTNHPKEEWVTWIQGVYRDFGPHLTKDLAALRAQVAELKIIISSSDKQGRIWFDRAVKAEKQVEELTESEERRRQEVIELTIQMHELEAEVNRLNERDGKAHIDLLMPTESNPFHRVALKVVDFGVADNVYVAESVEVESPTAANERMREALDKIAVIAENYATSPLKTCGDIAAIAQDAKEAQDERR